MPRMPQYIFLDLCLILTQAFSIRSLTENAMPRGDVVSRECIECFNRYVGYGSREMHHVRTSGKQAPTLANRNTDTHSFLYEFIRAVMDKNEPAIP